VRFAEPEIAGLTELAVERLLDVSRDVRGDRKPGGQQAPFALLEGGHLVVEVDSAMLVRIDAVTLIGDGLRVRRMPRRVAAGDVPGDGPLAIVDGTGGVVFARAGGTFHVVRLRRDRCFLREAALWAAEPSLHWENGVMPGTRDGDGEGDGAPFIRIHGDGVMALRSVGDLITVKVTPERAQRVDPAALIGWIGDVVALAEPGLALLRCEGEGALLLDLVSHRSAGERDRQ
jgi:hypothetical protein